MGRGSSPNGSAPPGTPFLPRETPNGATSTPFRQFLMFFVVFRCKNNTWGAHGAPMGAHGRPWGAHWAPWGPMGSPGVPHGPPGPKTLIFLKFFNGWSQKH